jgi:hypothetical protein
MDKFEFKQFIKECLSEVMVDDQNSPLYVEYHSERAGEPTFLLGGKKYQYVNAKYPNGKLDIGVYSHSEDLVYAYDAFRKMNNIQEMYNTSSGNKPVSKQPVLPNVRKSWGDLNPVTRVHGQGKDGVKPKYNRNRDKNWKRDLDEMSTTSAAQGFNGRNWGDPDPDRKKIKSIAARSVGGILAESLSKDKYIYLSGNDFDNAWSKVLKSGKPDDNGTYTLNDWQIVGHARNGLEEFGQLLYRGTPIINKDAVQPDSPPGT